MKTALITGSARGIGKSLAIALVKESYNIVINYNKSKEEAEKLKEYIESNFNVKTLLIKADVTNELEIKEMVNQIKKTFGKIDLLINNAGVAIDNEIKDKTKEEFLKVLETNLVGPFLVIKHASYLIDNGLIINISSTDSEDTYTEYSIDYCASKAGLNSLTKTVALALPNTKVISLLLSWVNTDSVKEMNKEYLKNELIRTNQERLYEPDEIAEKITNLIKENNFKTGDIIRL